jgi:cyclin-dependent kinase 7
MTDRTLYKEEKLLGRGRFGQVYLGVRTIDNVKVAIKKIMRDEKLYKQEGLSALGCLREIRVMRETSHPNLVQLLDVFISHEECGRCVNLVLELLLERDLEQVIRTQPNGLDAGAIKSLICMLLQGLEFLHSNWIVHRDLKPGNVFISHKGYLKIGDFGFARTFGSPDQSMSPNACTQWYRAPELLLGACEYGASVDVWSAGCIFGELWTGIPLFRGAMSEYGAGNEIDQLGKIFMHLGTPTLADWHHMDTLSRFIEFQPCSNRLSDMLPKGAAGVDAANELLGELLALDPKRRIACNEALKMGYFPKPPVAAIPGSALLALLGFDDR